MITTKTSKGAITPEEKQVKINNAREYHSKVLRHYGAKDTDFNLKLPFFDKGVKIVGIYPTEFKKANGFFLEFIDSKLDSIDSTRKIWRLAPTDNYEDVYNMLQNGAYAVPIEDLELIELEKEAPKKAQDFKVNFDTVTEIKDVNISNLTITDFAAIMWMKPVSQKEWLNNLINQNI